MGIIELIGLIVFVGLAYTAYWYNTKSKNVVTTELDPNVEAAHKNIKETTESVTAKVEVAPEATPAPAKDQAWINNTPAPINKKSPKKQPTKATTAPKRKKPAGK